jgi:hypothetical protein
LAAAVWLLPASALLAQQEPHARKPQPSAAQTVKPKPRPSVAKSDAAKEPVAPEAAIKKALASPTQVEFIDTPLQDVIDYLKDYHHIEIQLDRKALNDVGVEPDKPITKNLKGISLRSALRLILRDLDLTYVIEDEVLLITTRELAERQLTTKVYPVADLVECRNSKGQPRDDYDTLIEVITSIIQPTTWDAVGGAGSITGASLSTAKVLVVSQTQDVHEQIIDLLEQIRAIAAKTPDAGSPQRD